MAGSLRIKNERMLALGAVSVRPSPEVADGIRAGHSDAIAGYFHGVRLYVMNTLELTLRQCCKTLEEWREWRDLAETPKSFDMAVNRSLKVTATCLKLLNGIADHRPAKSIERDQQLYALRNVSPKLTFAKLAIKINEQFPQLPPITPQNAERIYKRQDQRAKSLLRECSQVINVCQQIHLTPGAWTEDLLPSPEDVFTILAAEENSQNA